MLSNLKTRGLGVLFITHDLSLGNYIAERTIILRRGVVVEMGATDKVFDNPQHEYTRMLLTSVPQLHKKWEAASPDATRRALFTRSQASTRDVTAEPSAA